MTTLTKECRRCKEVKPVSEFYKRKRYNSYVSECKTCMKERSKTQARGSKMIPRAETEIFAIDYLNENGFPALPGKAVSAADVDVVVWGHVWIEIKYSSVKVDDLGRDTFQWSATPSQQENGFKGHLVMLICDYNDGTKSFHLFRADDPVFYMGDKIKSGLSYFIGRTVPLKHGNNRVVMTDDLMESARDDLPLIPRVMGEISRELRIGA